MDRDAGVLLDILIHEYERVDLGEVWNAVERDVPELIRAIEPLVEKR